MLTFDRARLGTLDRDVTYCALGGLEQKMDIYTPTAGGPWPALVFVHGGAWTEGDKAPLPVNPVGAGYLVASINYRMYPDYRFPAMVEDVKCAIRYLRAHAAAYNLDPGRIALIGHSAGGHLVALAGLADESAGWDVGPYRDTSSRVQAVIEMSGPTDLTRSFPVWVEELKANVFGAGQWVRASPVSYVRPDAPRFLIVHGSADPAVPVEQAHLLHDALRQVGASSELVVMRNAGHGLEPVGEPASPSMEQVLDIMLVFLSGM